MIKNHIMFGNTSMIIMVGKVILLLHICSTKNIKVQGCYIFRESFTLLGHVCHGHAIRLQVFKYDMIPLDIL